MRIPRRKSWKERKSTPFSDSYKCIENSAGRYQIYFPVVVTLIYGQTMLYLNGIRKVDWSYPFLRVHDQSVKATVLWIFGMPALIAALSTLVWAATE